MGVMDIHIKMIACDWFFFNDFAIHENIIHGVIMNLTSLCTGGVRKCKNRNGLWKFLVYNQFVKISQREKNTVYGIFNLKVTARKPYL